MIIGVHFCWSFWLFEVTDVPSSSSVVVNHLHEDDTVFANVVKVECKFNSTQADDVDVDQPLDQSLLARLADIRQL